MGVPLLEAEAFCGSSIASLATNMILPTLPFGIAENLTAAGKGFRQILRYARMGICIQRQHWFNGPEITYQCRKPLFHNSGKNYDP
jgi:hypothetical protein